MTFRISLLLILITGFALSCSTGPEFERDNMNDPENGQFKPDPPSGANFIFSNDALLTISWKDRTQFETGYKIHKQIGDIHNELIATLPPNAEQFTDSTKEFGFLTSYLIAAEKDSLKSDSLIIKINFGEINDLESDLEVVSIGDPKIRLQWNDNVFFEDGFFLVRIFNEEPFEKRIKILNPELEEISIVLPNDSFVQEYKIIPYKIFKSDTTILPIQNSTTLNLAPKNFRMEINSEDSLYFSWDFIPNFHDEFLLELETENETKLFKVNKNKTELKIKEPIIKGFQYKAYLSAVKGNVYSSKISTSKEFEVQPILIDSIGHISDSELLIHTSNKSNVRLIKHVYRSNEITNTFSKVGEIPKGENTFLDTNLDKNVAYTYYIDTQLSNESPQVSISNRKGLKLRKSFPLDNHLNFRFQDRILFTKPYNSLIAIDSNTEKIVRIDYLNNSIISSFDLNFYPRDVALHSDPNIIAALKGSETETSLYVFDNNNNTKILIDSVGESSSSIGNINFKNDKILYMLITENFNRNLISSSLDGVRKDTLFKFTSEDNLVLFSLSHDKNEFAIVKYSNEVQLLKYSLAGSTVTLLGANTLEKYPIAFSPSFNSMLVSRSQYNLTVIDINTSNTLLSHEFGLYNSNSLRKSFFFGNGLFYAPDQAGAYIVDSKNHSNPILQTLGFGCCRISYAGAFFDKESQHIVDLRRSHTSGIPDFYTVYSLQSYWRVLE